MKKKKKIYKKVKKSKNPEQNKFKRNGPLHVAPLLGNKRA